MRRDSPGEQWGEIVRSAWLVKSHKLPDDIELRITNGELVDFPVDLVSDAQILASLIQELSEHEGSLTETRYEELPGPWP